MKSTEYCTLPFFNDSVDCISLLIYNRTSSAFNSHAVGFCYLPHVSIDKLSVFIKGNLLTFKVKYNSWIKIISY